MDQILVIKNIRKTFGGLVALDDVSLEVEKNKITMLIGPNGSGKTTLINCISGFYKPDRGEVFFQNTNITNWQPHKIFDQGLMRTFKYPNPSGT